MIDKRLNIPERLIHYATSKNINYKDAKKYMSELHLQNEKDRKDYGDKTFISNMSKNDTIIYKVDMFKFITNFLLFICVITLLFLAYLYQFDILLTCIISIILASFISYLFSRFITIHYLIRYIIEHDIRVADRFLNHGYYNKSDMHANMLYQMLDYELSNVNQYVFTNHDDFAIDVKIVSNSDIRKELVYESKNKSLTSQEILEYIKLNNKKMIELENDNESSQLAKKYNLKYSQQFNTAVEYLNNLKK